MAYMHELPEGLLFTERHVWLKMFDEYTCICGVTSQMLEIFSQVLFVDLPQVNLEIYINEKIATLESHLDIYNLKSPVSGKIVRVNNELLSVPELVNSDPYNEGWIVEIELKDRYQLDDLMDYERYTDHFDLWQPGSFLVD